MVEGTTPAKIAFEAIILAGGLGTRLASVTGGKPKVLADVGGKPFLAHLLDDLIKDGASRAILAVGYRASDIMDQFGSSYRAQLGAIDLTYVIEKELLGTGGAILNAMSALSGTDALVLNGDTWVNLDKAKMIETHRLSHADLTMAVSPVENVSRFGAVEIRDKSVVSFREKGEVGPGFINAGVYALTASVFEKHKPGENFSFERDILENRLKNQQSIAAYLADKGFIDIGVPEDYHRANEKFSRFKQSQS